MATERTRYLITPPINTSGIYTTYAPFILPANTVFRCSAIRSFKELEVRKINVFQTYYVPFGLGEDIYKADAAIGASIVTLEAGDGAEYYVPNTYIESYPGSSGLLYDRKVIVVELGLLPSTVSVDHLFPLIDDLVTKNVGVENKCRVAIAPYTGTVDHATHVQLENSRRVAIKSHKTLYEENDELKAQNIELRKQNELMAQALASQVVKP